jgi:adenine-specific DNA-methyltransferase
MASQLPLFPDLTVRFPSTRYQGSKAKLVDWIWEQIQALPFDTCLDAFGGTGAVGYRLKQEKKSVTYNDILRFNTYFGTALIENSTVTLSDDELNWLLRPHPEINYPDFVQRTFHDVYFTDEENAWIDRTITHIRQFDNPYKFAIAFFALSQACIIKRPYNLFHRKNLYIRFADVERSFGNKTTWDKPFDEWFRFFVKEANQAVFDNGRKNQALNHPAADIPGNFDLVYIDPPYISDKGTPVDYRDFYHFLEGLTMYDEWEQHVDQQSKHRRLKREPNPWANKTAIHAAFDEVFARFKDSIIVVSYRSDGIPGETALVHLLKQYKSTVQVKRYGQYKYVLSKNDDSDEILIVGK